MSKEFDESRRKLITATGLAIASCLVVPAVIIRRAHAEEPENMTEKPDKHESEGEEEVTPPEDLARTRRARPGAAGLRGRDAEVRV